MRATIGRAWWLMMSGAVLAAACTKTALGPDPGAKAVTAAMTRAAAVAQGPAAIYQEGIAIDSQDFVAFSPDGAGVVFSPDGATLVIRPTRDSEPRRWSLHDGSLRAPDKPPESVEPCYGAMC